VLETERLIIKAGTIDDFIKVHEFDFNYLQNIDGLFEFVKREPDEIRSWFPDSLDKFYQDIRSKNHYDFIVYLNESMIPIGHICFDRNDEKLLSTEVACYLHPNYWGNGYIKEALIKCMDYLFNNGFENIIYGYDSNNVKSKSLFDMFGFEFLEKHTEGNFNGGVSIIYKNIMSRERFYKLYFDEMKKVNKKWDN